MRPVGSCDLTTKTPWRAQILNMVLFAINALAFSIAAPFWAALSRLWLTSLCSFAGDRASVLLLLQDLSSRQPVQNLLFLRLLPAEEDHGSQLAVPRPFSSRCAWLILEIRLLCVCEASSSASSNFMANVP